MKFNLQYLMDIADSIGKIMGPTCEVVIHDLTKDISKSIVYIVNGQLSHRSVGGCVFSYYLENYEFIQSEAYTPEVNFSTDESGHVFKTISTIYKDEKGRSIYCFCINIDITELLNVKKFLVEFTAQQSQPEEKNEYFARTIDELADYYLEKIQREIGKRGCDMNKDEKLQALRYLEEKQFMKISKAHVILCEFFDISKYTLYAYLNEIRKEDDR